MSAARRRILITGATDGIGEFTAYELAKLGGWEILIHGRKKRRLQEVQAKLNELGGNAGTQRSAASKSGGGAPSPKKTEIDEEAVGVQTCPKFYCYDLSSLAQVHAFADEVRKDHGYLDVLDNNAGVFCDNDLAFPKDIPKFQSADKSGPGAALELTYMVNVVAPFVLACSRERGLLSLLEAGTARTRAAMRKAADDCESQGGYTHSVVLNISSISHEQCSALERSKTNPRRTALPAGFLESNLEVGFTDIDSQGPQSIVRDMEQEGKFDNHVCYELSKLYVSMFSQELAERMGTVFASGKAGGISDPFVEVVSCDPGTVNTKMLLKGWGACGIELEDATDELFILTNAGRGLSLHESADSPVELKFHGNYFVGKHRKKSPVDDVYDGDARKLLWDFLARKFCAEL